MHQGRRWIGIACVAMWLGLAGPSGAAADARTDFLVRMLSGSAQFRVRTQAALALGSQVADAGIVAALTEALRDQHPAVRAASAAALGKLRDPAALPSLRAAQADRDGSVRTAVRGAMAAIGAKQSSPGPGTGTPVFYVGVGVPGSQVGLSPSSLRSLRGQLVAQLAELEGVSMAPENEDRRAATQVLATRKLIGYFVDSSVTGIEQKPDGSVRAQVSVILGTYPGRDMRALLSGAATVTGGGDDAKEQAIQAAFSSALRRLPQAMQAGKARAP